MDSSTRDDYFWLLSDAARPVLAHAMESFRQQENVVRLARLLRKDVSVSRSAIVMEQAQLRLRATKKFPQADEMFFTRRGLEQATGVALARYKAAAFESLGSVADVCCGVGGDLLALHHRGGTATGSTTVGVDADELTAQFAAHNLKVCGGAETGTVQHTTFEAFAMNEVDALHIDPDRRGKQLDGKRTTVGSRFEPPLESVFARTTGLSLAAIKIAPATRDANDWPADIEREWIGDRRECKQQVIWLGERASRIGHRTATCVDEAGVATRFSVPNEKVLVRVPPAEALGEFLYEPHAAVLAARLDRALAKQFDLQPVADDVAYFTGGPIASSPLISAFRIREVFPLHLRKLADALRKLDIGTLEVKRRGVEQTAGDELIRLKFKGTTRATVILTRLGMKRMAILADRVVS